MINVVSETLTDKTISQYKIIEREHLILKRYLMLFFENKTLMNKEELDLILRALESEPRKEETNE
jgi:hypothetical protein